MPTISGGLRRDAWQLLHVTQMFNNAINRVAVILKTRNQVLACLLPVPLYTSGGAGCLQSCRLAKLSGATDAPSVHTVMELGARFIALTALFYCVACVYATWHIVLPPSWIWYMHGNTVGVYHLPHDLYTVGNVVSCDAILLQDALNPLSVISQGLFAIGDAHTGQGACAIPSVRQLRIFYTFDTAICRSDRRAFLVPNPRCSWPCVLRPCWHLRD